MINNNIINSYFNQSINAELMKHMKSIMGSKHINLKNVIMLLTLLGIDTIKTNVNSAMGIIMQKSSNYLIDCLVKFKNYIISKIYKKIP